MIVKENISLYICEFCKKRLIVKQAMERHEKLCYQNPANDRACSNCAHLEEIEIKYQSERFYDGGHIEEERATKGFFCRKFNKKLYPFKVEKLGLLKKFPDTFDDQDPMPKECSEWTMVF